MLYGYVGSGGGVKTGRGVGARRHLIINKGIEFDVEGGNSGEALNTPFMCQYPKGELYKGVARLEHWWRSIRKPSDVMTNLWFWQVPREMAFKSSSPLWRKFKRAVDPDLIQSSGRGMIISVTDLTLGRNVMVDETFCYPWLNEFDAPLTKREKLKILRSSWTIPWVNRFIVVRRHVLVDGGVTINSPLYAVAMRLASDPRFPHEGARIYLNEHYTDILPQAPLLYKGTIGDYNDRILETCLIDNWRGDHDGATAYMAIKDIELVRVQHPVQQQGDSLDFTPETINRHIVEGYEAWRQAVP